MIWNSQNCSCVHEFQVCEQDPDHPDIFYFFCIEEGHCRCMFTGTLAEEEYFDMLDCVVKQRHQPEIECIDDAFWNGYECQCLMKDSYTEPEGH